MVFVSFLLSFLIFLYGALAAPLDYVVSADFNVALWGLAFFVLGHLIPGAVVTYQTRRVPRG